MGERISFASSGEKVIATILTHHVIPNVDPEDELLIEGIALMLREMLLIEATIRVTGSTQYGID